MLGAPRWPEPTAVVTVTRRTPNGLGRRGAAGALAVALLGVLTGCSTSLGWSAPQTTQHRNVADILVTGAPDTPPTVTVPTPFAVSETSRRVLSAGDGPLVVAGQRVTVQYVGVNGTDGRTFDSSWTRSPASFVVGVGDYVMKGVVQGLIGVPVGSRVVVAVPSKDAYGVAGSAERGIGPTDTIVFVMDVASARDVLKRATGAKVTPPKGLPKVTLADDGTPSLAISGSPTNALVVQTLIKGKGAPVTRAQSITVHYIGEVWGSKVVFDSSWKRKTPSTFTIGTGEVLAGWDQGLVGQRVGSQVLLIVPPDKGYGAMGKPAVGIKGTDVLVFVVDILDAA